VRIVSELSPLVLGELTIEPRRAAGGGSVDLFWRGKSNDRHPARSVVPYVADVLAGAQAENALVRLHFETIEHMNSSTITAIIQIIQDARTRRTQLVIVFDPSKNWQKLSFEALGVFVKGDGLLQIIGERMT
jgi:hypothetical protein